MSNPLFNKFGGGNYYSPPQRMMPQNSGNGLINLIRQYKQIQNNPGAILDILLQNGKINQQQYNELQSVRNNPQQIFNYLSQHGNASQLNMAQQMFNSAQNGMDK